MRPIPILMYHSISDEPNKMSVTKENFLKQMSMMKKLGFEGVKFKGFKKY